MFIIIVVILFLGFSKLEKYKKEKRKQSLKEQKLKADCEFSKKYNIKVLY